MCVYVCVCVCVFVCVFVVMMIVACVCVHTPGHVLGPGNENSIKKFAV